MDRHSFGDWEAIGKPTMRQKIREKVAKILTQPAVPVLPTDVAQGVRAVRQRAEAALTANP